MDIIAHALWTTAAAKLARDKTRQPLRLGWAAVWGVFPDLFSFTVPAVVRIWWYVTGTTHSLLPDAHSAPRFQFVWQLYHCSHSLLVFAAVFGLVWAVSFAKSLCPKLKGVLPVWRKLFGLGLQADSSTGERCSLRRHEPSSAGLQAKAFGHQKTALESTMPPHNDGAGHRVSGRIESSFHAQSEFL